MLKAVLITAVNGIGMNNKKNLLDIRDVGFRVGDNTILQHVDFCLSPGEFKLITGPSGCGKSTLLKIVAYCVQTPSLFGDTVYDNLVFPWHIRNQTPDPKKFTDDLTRFGLSPETLTKSIAELSGGEKQRVSLIRNLQFLPKALLLDEITSALDDANKRNVNDIIHRYAREQNIAVLWVTHDSNEITHADDVITLRPQGGKMEEAHRG